MRMFDHKPGLRAGFTQIEAITLAGCAGMILALLWAGFWIGGEKRRIWVCAGHLKTLGQAFSACAEDHQGALPPAFYDDGQTSNSWDSSVAVYLESQRSRQLSAENLDALRPRVAPLFKCPSDPGPSSGAPARSYAMPVYDINRVGWPPDESSLGGLGLYLDARTLKKARQATPEGDSEMIPKGVS